MARINIEECWWSDARRNKLIELLKGNSRLADGLMLQAWKLAQNHCTSEGGLIPLSQFLCLTEAEVLFECDLAVLVQANTKQTPSKAKQIIATAKEDAATLHSCQAYVRGSEEHHKWLSARRKAGASGGKKSAKRGRDEGGRLQANAKQKQANASNGKQSQASYSSSYSSSTSYSLEEENTYMADNKPPSSSNNETAAREPELLSEFEEYYEHYPRRDGDQRKKQGLATCSKKFTTQEKKAELLAAIKNYNAYCVRKGWVGTEYVKQFGTFVNGAWQEYVKPPEGLNGTVLSKAGGKTMQVVEEYAASLFDQGEGNGH